ncbi:MAG: 5-oxoprolinase subunit PxpB [Syntrophales bacterium]|nr:5-oxoprolinase subunit PxpB [Syntrophales bacterium]
MIISRYGENGIRLVFGNAVTLDVHERVRRCFQFLQENRLPYIIDIIPAFCSCLILFDDQIISFEDLSSFLRKKKDLLLSAKIPKPLTHQIPVHYGGESGPDLDFVASHTGLSCADVISLHTGTLYTVFTVGFIPGFPYLGPLDQRLYTPRLKTPRVRVPAGSVGIALNQTGIYPFDSPGGWQLIGRTETRLFDKERKPFSLMKIGDKVRFMRE